MFPKSGEQSQGTQDLDGLRQAIASSIEKEKEERRKKAGLNVLHSFYYTYKARFHTEPKDVFEMLKGLIYLLEG